MVEKACKNCRLIITGEVCPACNGTVSTKNWEGYILITNAEDSEIAQAIGTKLPGKYALKIK